MEQDPYLRLSLADGKHLDVTPANSSLYTHAGGPAFAQYDHVFVVAGEENGTPKGAYFFRHQEVFESLRQHLMQFDYPLHLNMPRVAEGDMAVFEQVIAQDELRDLEGESVGVPEEWLNGGS